MTIELTTELTFQNFKTTVELTRDFLFVTVLFVTVHRAPQQELAHFRTDQKEMGGEHDGDK